MSNAEMSSVLQKVTKACSAAMNNRLQELTIELPARPLRVAADPDKVVEAFVLILVNESRKSPEGSEFILAVTASDFALRVCVSSARGPQSKTPSDLTQQTAVSDHDISGVRIAHDTDLTEACRIIVEMGGTIMASTPAGMEGRQLIVGLPLRNQLAIQPSSTGVPGDQSHRRFQSPSVLAGPPRARDR